MLQRLVDRSRVLSAALFGSHSGSNCFKGVGILLHNCCETILHVHAYVSECVCVPSYVVYVQLHISYFFIFHYPPYSDSLEGSENLDLTNLVRTSVIQAPGIFPVSAALALELQTCVVMPDILHVICRLNSGFYDCMSGI